ncbi:tetratricopeptide repeat protein [Marinobacter segnicrescens]|uniref:tetratricopeptide repeat protein n=1 Tax=Marinobacter segnicrescens TaxID=430453 RepID=UPI003A94733E
MNTALRFLAAAATSSILVFTAGCSSSDDTNSEAAGHITRAETYADQGQYRSAMLEVRNAVQKDPGNVDHVLVLAGIYNSIGAGEQATDLLEPWQEDHGDQVALPLARGYTLQGKHLSAREALDGFQPQTDSAQREYDYLTAESQRLAGNTEQAVSQLRSLQEAHPANAEITVALAKALLASGEANAAVNTLTQWTEQNGDNAEVLYLTGLAHYRMGNIDESTQVLTDATAAVPTSDIFLPVRRSILTLLSRSLTEQGRITEAQVYNKILAENTSSDTRERAESALEAILRGDMDTARTTLEELIRQNPDNEQVALMLGTLRLQEGEREEAERLLAGNIDAETTPTPFLRAATIAQVDSGKREEALGTLSRAIEARPKDVELLAMHGILALSLEEYKEAGVASLSKALELDRSRSRLRLALARHYMSEEQQEQALAQMRVAFTETPTDWTVTQSYLALLMYTGREKEAEEVKESLLNGFANEPPALLLASLAELRLGETETALNRLEKLTNDNPESALTHQALASAYQRTGNTDKALESLITAATLTPDSIRPLSEAARLYASTHTSEETISWLQELGTQRPEIQFNATVLAAQARIQQGRTKDARALLEKLPQNSREDTVVALTSQLLVTEAEQAAQAKDWETARAKAGEVATLQPGNVNLALLPARYAAMEGNTDSALSTLNEVEATFGEQPATVRSRAQLLMLAERPDEAMVTLENYYQDSENPAILADLIQLSRSEAPDKVDSLTEQWVERQPASPAAHLARADHLMSKGLDAQALPRYEQVLELQPNNVRAMNNLAWLLRENDRPRALGLASQAAQLAPESAAVQDTYGWLLHLDGQHEQAVEQLGKALALDPDNQEIENHLNDARQAL